MIGFDEKLQQFHLYNDHISYVFRIMENQQLEQLYYGARVDEAADYTYLSERGHRDMQAYPPELGWKYSLEHIKQEYPTCENGDMRYPAYRMVKENGSRVFDFRYMGHEIYHGKKAIKGLPATYVEDDREAESLEIYFKDESSGVQMTLHYSIYKDLPVIARHTSWHHLGEEPVVLDTAMSLSLDLPDKDYKMLELTGAWARERHMHLRELAYGTQGIYSMRGCSSQQYNPFLALLRKDATEHSGEVIGASLLYSGNFLGQVEVDNLDVTRVLLGIHPDGFSWKLEKGETFETPEAVLVYSQNGLGGMSRAFHKLFRKRLVRGPWRDKSRPILINNWEATYFNFDEEKLLAIAKKAADVGVELFVLDDGWFGKRDDSESSLGDWYPYEKKLPNGVKGLSEKIRDLGLSFGLWIEPEMVNEDSDLYRAHPDWVLGKSDKLLLKARGQWVLDFSKEEVVEHIYSMISKVMKESKVSYIKWDMNRSFGEVFSQNMDASSQGKVRHKYILGVYRLYEMLRRDFPDVLFESCASGGARFDAGMLYYAPQAWTSDDTDAMERLRIQYGTSVVYPISAMGSHVSAVPNDQVFRKESLRTRANVAYFGTFGYELDITKSSPEELSEMKEQISFMKSHRDMIAGGDFYRLISPFRKDGNKTSWMVVSPHKESALVGYYRVLQHIEQPYERLRLQGLDENTLYEVKELFTQDGLATYQASGRVLMNVGISVSDASSGIRGLMQEEQGDYFSRLFSINSISRL